MVLKTLFTSMRHPIQLLNYMGCLIEFYTSLKLFYTKMSFKILKIFQQIISLFPEQSTLHQACLAKRMFGPIWYFYRRADITTI
jgi:hypothetical protein